MIVCRTIAQLRTTVEAYRAQGRTIGWIPTMGALHAGHESLIHCAREAGDVAVVSVFVNPLQFGPSEDYARYPRPEAQDLQTLTRAHVEVAFMPDVAEVFPRPLVTTVHVEECTAMMCGASRPAHFDGVATIVTKFLHIICPQRAYFGMKDAQQVAVIQRVIEDLSLSVTVVRCPTLREADGLAYSSRNAYLSPEQRKHAPQLYASLQRIDEWLSMHPQGEAPALCEEVARWIQAIPGCMLHYVEVHTYPDLRPVGGALAHEPCWIIAIAATFGTTRLIDNRLFHHTVPS